MSTLHQRYIYFIAPDAAASGIGCLIKIGSSSNPQKRLAEFRKWSPVPLELLCSVPGDHRTEFFLHDLFDGSWVRDEWFAPTIGLARLINHIQAHGSLPEWAVPGAGRLVRPVTRKSLASRPLDWRKAHGEKSRRAWAERSRSAA